MPAWSPPVGLPTFRRSKKYGYTVFAAQAAFALFTATAIRSSSADPILSAAVVGAAFAQGPLIGIWAVLGPGRRWRRILEAGLMFLILALCYGQGFSWRETQSPDSRLWQGAIIVHAGSALVCATLLGMIRKLGRWRLSGPGIVPSAAQFSLRFALLLVLASCIILAWMRVLPWAQLLEAWHEYLTLKAVAMLVCGCLLSLPSIPFVVGAFRQDSCRDWFFNAYAIPIICVLLFLAIAGLSTNSFLRVAALQPVMELFFGYTFFVLNVGATLLGIRSFGYRWLSPVVRPDCRPVP